MCNRIVAIGVVQKPFLFALADEQQAATDDSCSSIDVSSLRATGHHLAM